MTMRFLILSGIYNAIEDRHSMVCIFQIPVMLLQIVRWGSLKDIQKAYELDFVKNMVQLTPERQTTENVAAMKLSCFSI